METEDIDVLIVGAGPTGLAAGIFLTDLRLRVRIIDEAPQASATSRAQVINPRSFELLHASGLTHELLTVARPLAGVHFYEDWHDLAHLDFSDIHPRFPMAALPQVHTETILTTALAGRGVTPERPLRLAGFYQTEDAVIATVRKPDGSEQLIASPLLLAADGAHSGVRHSLGLEFDGSSFPEEWPLYDVDLDVPLDGDHAHVLFLDRGLVFALRIGARLWRVFGNVPAPLDHLPPGTAVGDIRWKSTFHISHRLASRTIAGRVALAGDAAHIHSPVAARGMNLGIEDAYTFAISAKALIRGEADALENYGRKRHAVHSSVVRNIERLTWLARGQPGLVGTIRNHLIPGMTRLSPAAHAMLGLLTGLDHAVELQTVR